jgi:hypothetical protein
VKRFTIVFIAAILSVGILITPAISGSSGGHGGGGGHSGGFHGGGFHGGYYGGYHGGYSGRYYGGYYGGYRYYGGPILGFGAGLWAGYYPWDYAPYYYPYNYPYYYPAYPYYPPPIVYDSSSAVKAPSNTYVIPPSVSQSPNPGNILPPPMASENPPYPNQRRCQKWAPTGEFHNESRWNSQTQTMETVSVPNFAWQDYPCK